MAKVWSNLTELRNDIAHCGMNDRPQTAANLKQKVLKLYPELEKIAKELLPRSESVE